MVGGILGEAWVSLFSCERVGVIGYFHCFSSTFMMLESRHDTRCDIMMNVAMRRILRLLKRTGNR